MRRLWIWVLALVLVGSHVANAATVAISIEALNSRLTFGQGPTYQLFYDIDVRVCDEDGDCQSHYPTNDDPYDPAIEAFDSVLVQQTLHHSGGQVVGSTYEYEGGTLEMFLTFSNGGTTVSGGFTAPIVSLLVSAPNATGGDGDSLDAVDYVLGRGLFDPALAKFLGIRPQTPGGILYSWMLLRAPHGGDHLSEEREAWDGGSYIELDVTPVPEPAMLWLTAIGVIAAGCCVRWQGARPE